MNHFCHNRKCFIKIRPQKQTEYIITVLPRDIPVLLLQSEKLRHIISYDYDFDGWNLMKTKPWKGTKRIVKNCRDWNRTRSIAL